MSAVQVPAPPNANDSTKVTGIPVTVFTGFLGSGKTTVISHLLKSLKDTDKVVFIKNEQGDIDLDSKLIAASGIVSQELLNGCVCCTLMGPLLETIDQLIDTYQPSRILLESSGTAEPINLAITLNGNPRIYRDGVVNIVDALNHSKSKLINDHYELQAKLTDIILLNKVETLSQAEIVVLTEEIKQVNSYSPIVLTSEGRVDPELIFGMNQHFVVPEGLSVHAHDSSIDSFTYRFNHQVTQEKLHTFLENLPENLIRVKGVVLTPTPLVVNQAFKRISTFELDTNHDIEQGFLYFIGTDLTDIKAKLLSQLEQL